MGFSMRETWMIFCGGQDIFQARAAAVAVTAEVEREENGKETEKETGITGREIGRDTGVERDTEKVAGEMMGIQLQICFILFKNMNYMQTCNSVTFYFMKKKKQIF